MRRIAAAIAFFAIAAPAHAAGPAEVELTDCAPRDRAAEFEARMGEVAGAERLKMRFTLHARKRGRHRHYHRVDAPGFSDWTTADPGTSRYVFTRRVEGLVGPARYRAKVRFKWLDADDHVIRSARRYSRSCRQPDHRSNLKVKGLSREGKRRYVALVRNSGRTESGAFDLALTVGGTMLAPVAVESLEPREETLVTLRGPACTPGTEISATADPRDLIDERSERDNVFTTLCE